MKHGLVTILQCILLYVNTYIIHFYFTDSGEVKENQQEAPEEVADEEEKMEQDGEDGSEAKPTDVMPADQQLTPCAPSLATRIHRIILRSILPQLHRCLTQKVSVS